MDKPASNIDEQMRKAEPLYYVIKEELEDGAILIVPASHVPTMLRSKFSLPFTMPTFYTPEYFMCNKKTFEKLETSPKLSRPLKPLHEWWHS